MNCGYYKPWSVLLHTQTQLGCSKTGFVASVTKPQDPLWPQGISPDFQIYSFKERMWFLSLWPENKDPSIPVPVHSVFRHLEPQMSV